MHSKPLLHDPHDFGHGQVMRRSNRGFQVAKALAAALACLVGCAEPAPPEAHWFELASHDSGIDFVHQTGASGQWFMPEMAAPGLCLLDFNGDGFLDVYFVQSGKIDQARGQNPPNRLFESVGGRSWTDVTGAAGVGDRGYGMGCATGDFDGDGRVDLYVTNLGPNALYRNLGNGRFANETEASGTAGDDWSTSAGFADFDADGRQDLFVVNYIDWAPHREIECHNEGSRDYCSPNNYSAPSKDRFLRNLGDGRFEDASEASGLAAAFGNGLGLRLADLDADGDIDAYVANDGMANQLWINDGTGLFTDEAVLRGAALSGTGLPEAGMGIAAADIDADGDEDLLITHLHEETNTLYVNLGGAFDDRTAVAGLASPSIGRTGFGTGFADLDNDGLLDLFIANGKVKRGVKPSATPDPYAEANTLLRGTRSGRFEVVAGAGPVTELPATSRGAAVGDLDNDGAIDIVVSNRDAPPSVLLNLAGAKHSWITFRALDQGIEALGARIQLEVGGQSMWRTVTTVGSYCSANDPRVHFGLGDADRVERIVVHWLDGERESFGPYGARAAYELVRGDGSDLVADGQSSSP